MKLHYYQDPHGNFGDDLNLWLWDRLLPQWREAWPDRLLVGVGTLLDARDLPEDVCKVVLGSGVGYGTAPDIAADPAKWDIRAVRGPRSAAALGLPPEAGITDGAVLISDFDEFRDLPKRPRPIFVPHHRSCDRLNWDKVCTAAGVDYVSPTGDAREVISAIASAPLVLTESMHGAILGDAFRVPWVAISVNHLFNEFKWQDWAESLDITLKVHPLFPELDAIAAALPNNRRKKTSTTVTTAPRPAAASGTGSMNDRFGPRGKIRLRMESYLATRNLKRLCKAAPQLSDAAVLEQRKAQFYDMVDKVARDMAGGAAE